MSGPACGLSLGGIDLSLRTVSVNQCLEKKLLIFGYEIPEILAIFFMLSVLNFVFGATGLKLFLVWLPSLTVAVVLRIGKRGKPDNYLVHLARFKFLPPLLSAFADSKDFVSPPRRTIRGTP